MPIKSTETPMKCNCGVQFGIEYRLNGALIGALLRVDGGTEKTHGGFIVTESAHGVCANCGRGLHIVVSTKNILLLMKEANIKKELHVDISE